MKKVLILLLVVLAISVFIVSGCKKKTSNPASSNSGPSGGPTPTFTPGPDTYEPDNSLAEAKPISFGQSQWHNLTPTGDVDYVYFNVVAGNRYMIKADAMGNTGFPMYFEFSYDEGTYNYYCYQNGTQNLDYTYEVYYATFTAQVYMYVGSYNNIFGNDTYYQLSLIQMPALTTVPLASALDNTYLAYSTGGNSSWFGQTGISSAGGSAAQSGHIYNNQSTYLCTTISTGCTVNFMWKVSSELSNDILAFYVDNVQNSLISGEVDWAQKSVVVSGAGSHVISWVYSRDVSDNWGYDAGWVDNIQLTP